MVPAQVLPSVRCAQCGFMFFGTRGSRCEICRAKDVPHEVPEAPDGRATDAAASALITEALDTLPEREGVWRQDLETRLTKVERQAQALLEEVAGIRQTLHHARTPQGDRGG